MTHGRAWPMTARVALLAGMAALSGCSSLTASGGAGVFTAIDETTPITIGAPMNPFNTTSNTFVG